VNEIDWSKVKDLIEKSERHSRSFALGDALTEEEWRYLAVASGRDRERYLKVFESRTGKR